MSTIEEVEEQEELAPPRPLRESLRKTIAVYAGGNVIATGLQLLGGFLATRLVGPTVLGLFNSYMLFGSYLPLLGLGVFEGFNRELPYCHGVNDPERTKRVIGVSQSWAFFLGSACFLVFFAVAGWNALAGDWPEATGWATVAATSFVLFFATNYLETVYRAYGHYTRLSSVYVVRSGVSFVLVAAVWLFGYYGLCIRSLGLVAAGSINLWRWRPVRERQRWDLPELWTLIKIGAPIMLITQISALWFVINRTFVLGMLGFEALGLYSLYPMMLPALQLLPTAVSQVVYPRISEMYGREQNITKVTYYALRPILLLTAGMIPIVAVAWWLMPFAVDILLPKYAEGVPAAQWALLDMFVICLMQIRVVFFTIQRQYVYFVGMVVGIVANVIAMFCFWLSYEQVPLVTFPQSQIIGRAIYIAVSYATLYWICRRDAVSRRDKSINPQTF